MDGGVADTTSQDVSRLVYWQKVVGERDDDDSKIAHNDATRRHTHDDRIRMFIHDMYQGILSLLVLTPFWMADGDAFADARDALGTFLAAAEGLHARLGRAPDGSSAAGSSARESIDDVLHCSAEVQAAIARAFKERDGRRHAARLREKAAARQNGLLALAQRMHHADGALTDVLQRSRDALAAAEASASSTRHAPMATIIEYAERVSYSNAAPCGDVAFEGAQRQGWYHGWGAYAPQQHMLAQSSFALGRPAAEGGSLPAEAANGDAGAAPPALQALASISTASLPNAPAYTAAVAPPPVGASDPQASERVSLGFDSSDDDEEDEFS